MPRYNRWVDLVDRAGWTFIQTFLMTMVVFGFDEWKANLGAGVLAGAAAALKTMIAQRTGDSPLGDAVPGTSVVKGPLVPE